MISLKEYLKNKNRADDYLFVMANIKKEKTNLPMIVWIQVKQSMKHNFPRMKFANNTSNSLVPIDLVPISISKNPKILSKGTTLKISNSDFQQLRNWIIRNEENLLKVWNSEIDTGDFLELMK